MTGEQLRQLRKRYDDTTLEELASAMGLSQHVGLVQMENGSRKITPAFETRIRRALRRLWRVRQLARLAAKELAKEVGRLASA